MAIGTYGEFVKKGLKHQSAAFFDGDQYVLYAEIESCS